MSIRQILQASLEASNLPVPRWVDLEAELDELDGFASDILKDKEELADLSTTTSTMEAILESIEKQKEKGTLSPESMEAYQIALESIFVRTNLEVTVESIGLESSDPDTGVFRQFVAKLKAFVKEKTAALMAKLRDFKQQLWPTVIGIQKEASEMRKRIDSIRNINNTMTLDHGVMIDGLDISRLDTGKSSVDEPSTILSLYRAAAEACNEKFVPKFVSTYGTITEEYHRLDVSSLASYLSSMSKFLDRFPSVASLAMDAGVFQAYDNVGIKPDPVNPLIIKRVNSYVEKEDTVEELIADFVLSSQVSFNASSSKMLGQVRVVPAMSFIELDSVVKTIEADARYMQEHERTLGTMGIADVDEETVTNKLGLFTNLSAKQKMLFNEFTDVVFELPSMPWDIQMTLYIRQIRAYRELLKWADKSLAKHSFSKNV